MEQFPASPPPDFCIVGTVTHDERPEGLVLGGTVTYSGITARNLGLRTAVVTRASDDIVLSPALDGIEVVRLHAAATTTFRNVYTRGKRTQYLLHRAGDIRADDVPPAFRRARIAMLGPLARDLESEVVRVFDKETLVGVVPQGWLRQWDDQGRVHPRPFHEAAEILPHADVFVLSKEDLGEYADLLEDYARMTPIVVLTRGPLGCTVFERGKKPIDVPAFQANEVDPTGAGDVFTAAFLIRLKETGDPREAARFANCAAAFAIEGIGIANIPTREMIEARMASGK